MDVDAFFRAVRVRILADAADVALVITEDDDVAEDVLVARVVAALQDLHHDQGNQGNRRNTPYTRSRSAFRV